MENKDFEKILKKWFEMKLNTYDRLEHDDSIYFYYEGEKYAEFRIDKNDEYVFYKWGLYKEFSEIIPLKYREFEMVIIKWVEDTFGLMGITPIWVSAPTMFRLKIPKINN